MGALNLPPVPNELKLIAPYLQRAEEVKSTDPIISYWCAYHAAQLGISLKVKDTNARTFLFDLLDLLEKMKSEIGPNDAIDDESASSAYVENFALRVFTLADNEDRKGNATRGTAKKFLAAANFLEVLAVVSTSTPPTINVPEKIRYAKWKAADIAKAFREGRKPTPGGAGEQSQPEEEPAIAPIANEEPTTPPAIQRSIPPPEHITDIPVFSHETHISPEEITTSTDNPTSPGEWSTVATPGADTTRNELFSSPSVNAPQRAWVSEDIEGTDAALEPQESSGVHQGLSSPPPQVPQRPEISTVASDTSAKKVHFTPSVTGGLTPSTPGDERDSFSFISPPPPSDFEGHAQYGQAPSAPPLDNGASLPPGFVPSPARPPPPPLPTAPPPIIQSSTPPPPVLSYPSQPQPLAAAIPPPGMLSSASTVTQSPEDLTPHIIARVQKHCKFAISALDYEDAEQARKELRAALRMLGG